MLTDEKVEALRAFLGAQIRRADELSLEADGVGDGALRLAARWERTGLQVALIQLNELDTPEPGMGLERRYNTRPVRVEL
jgi:hypothetical protein